MDFDTYVGKLDEAQMQELLRVLVSNVTFLSLAGALDALLTDDEKEELVARFAPD